MNPLSRVLSKRSDKPLTEAELDEQDAAAKADRVKHHFSSVRNGPVTYKPFSTGQQRRQRARDKASFERKLNRRQHRDYMAKRLDTAILRGHLQVLGVVSTFGDSNFAPGQRADSVAWVVGKYGPRNHNGELSFHDDTLREAIAAARAEYIKRTGAA